MNVDRFQPVAERLRRDRAPEPLVRQLAESFRQLAEGATGLLGRDRIAPPGELPAFESLGDLREAGRVALSRAVVVKLNGGLGTSMGLETAKSLIPVKDGRTFIDIIVAQIEHLRRVHGAPLPLLLMNSAGTQEDTLRALAAHPTLEAGQPGIAPCFLQHRIPKLRQADLRPIEWPADPELEWCPPGHGDLYLALVTSGRLAELRARGFEYAFVSNADNLGASLDLSLLGYFASSKLPFLMEVTRRTEADRKGGHLAAARTGGLLLRESAQCPPDEQAEFQDVQRYCWFNTNNLWVNLSALARAMDEGWLALPPIFNRKTVDPRDPSSTPVLQIETAMGAAIALFPGAGAVVVPRSRFAPVKTTEDLLALWSDAYALTLDQRVELRPERHGRPVLVRLDDEYFKLYDRFAARFPHGAPSLLTADVLTVEGDVLFGERVVVRGRARIRHVGAGQRRVPDGAVLQGEVEL